MKKGNKVIKINLPTSWNELSENQLVKLSLLFSKKRTVARFHRDVFFILMDVGTWNFKKRYNASLVLKELPLSKLIKYFEFIYEQSTRTVFPKKIKLKGKVFHAPMDRLQNLSASEFSAADDLHNRYLGKQELIYLKYLTAVLYVEKKHPRPVFDKLALEDKMLFFNDMREEDLISIHLAYQGCKNHIVKKYEKIFPKSVKAKASGKKFGFGKVIQKMTAGDLSKLELLENINIYKFLDQFQDDLEEASKSKRK